MLFCNLSVEFSFKPHQICYQTSLRIQHLLGYVLLLCCLYGYNICWVMCSCYAVFMDTTSVELCALAMLSLWLQHLLGYLLLIYYLYGYNICWVINVLLLCCLYGYNICWVICSCYAVFMDTTSVGLCALAMLSLWLQHLLGYVLLQCCLYGYNICWVMCS